MSVTRPSLLLVLQATGLRRLESTLSLEMSNQQFQCIVIVMVALIPSVSALSDRPYSWSGNFELDGQQFDLGEQLIQIAGDVVLGSGQMNQQGILSEHRDGRWAASKDILSFSISGTYRDGCISFTKQYHDFRATQVDYEGKLLVHEGRPSIFGSYVNQMTGNTGAFRLYLSKDDLIDFNTNFEGQLVQQYSVVKPSGEAIEYN